MYPAVENVIDILLILLLLSTK